MALWSWGSVGRTAFGTAWSIQNNGTG